VVVILPPVEIGFLGHSCFRLKGKEAVLLSDPFDPSLGYPWPSPQADIVTISHLHPGHSYVAGVGGEPRIIQGPGEYETKGVFVLGLATYHDSEQGKKLGRNTIYLVEMDDVRVLHLGDLGHPLSSEMVGELGRVDLLLVPVGGGAALGARAAAGLVRALEPRVVIPMHYCTASGGASLEPVVAFLKEMGAEEAVPQPRLSISRVSLPAETRLILLDHRR
jgi:L-ascorbate metabolism protein UlaG (beta-lactamase superfamily)